MYEKHFHNYERLDNMYEKVDSMYEKHFHTYERPDNMYERVNSMYEKHFHSHERSYSIFSRVGLKVISYPGISGFPIPPFIHSLHHQFI